MSKPTLYLGNVLEAFAGGAQLDLRFRLAVELMKAHGPETLPNSTPQQWAEHHLDAAEHLIKLSEDRGWALPLPEGDTLSAPFKAHLRRAARTGIYQQLASQEIGQEEERGRLARASALPPGVPPGRLT